MARSLAAIKFYVQSVKRKAIFFALLSGILLSLTAHPVSFKFLIWFALAPLFLAVSYVTFWQAFGLGILTGTVYFCVYLGWITHYRTHIFFLVLPCVLFFIASFSALTCLCYQRFRKGWFLQPIAPAFIWVGLQYIYERTPLGSAAMHLETLQSPFLLQAASFFGDSVLTFFILAVNGFLAYGLLKWNKKAIFFFEFFLLLLLGVSLWGREISKAHRPSKLRVACVQPNFPIDEYWRYLNAEQLFSTYGEMAQKAAENGARLIVFPQYRLPVDVFQKPERIAAIAQATKAYIVLGTYVQDPGTHGKYNVAVVFSPEGKIIGEYRAVNAPPFRRIGQIKGREYSVIETPLGRLGILLCYDDVESKAARILTEKGAQILVSMMNNGHFGKSKQLYLHFDRDVSRAVETRRYVVRSATTGLSGVITPAGKVLIQSHPLEKELVMADVSLSDEQTFFVKWGHYFSLVCFFVSLALIVPALRKE